MVAVVCVFAFTACKEPLSATSADTSKVGVTNGLSTNGGITAIYGEYLYFVNGTKTNDGKSSSGNTRGGIARAKYNKETGEIDKNTYQILISDLAGFSNTSLYFFGDFMYYTTPSGDVNYKDNVLYYKTKFMRYDLVNGKSHEIYTTKQNSSSESISFAYYVVGTSLNLVVFEKTNATLTSIKIGDEPSTNYVISGVTSALLSENNGKVVTAGATADANSFVFYTTSNQNYDKYQTGSKVYRTSPVAKNSSVCLSDEGLSISLLCIRNGKLLFSVNSKIFCQPIDANTTSLDTESYKNVISHGSYDDVVFIENEDGSVSILYFETKNKTYQISYFTWKDGIEINNTPICTLSNYSNFSFISLVTLEEEKKEETPSTGEGSGESGESSGETTESGDDSGSTEDTETTPAKKYKVTYVTYIADNYAYKLEIMRENDEGKMQLSVNAKPVKLSSTKVQDASGMLIPEIVGNYMYAFVNELDGSNKETGNIYLYRMDLTISKDATSNDKAEFVGIKES